MSTGTQINRLAEIHALVGEVDDKLTQIESMLEELKEEVSNQTTDRDTLENIESLILDWKRMTT